jgi:two-component system phosphate regulon sensor histidine kinase PhoR
VHNGSFAAGSALLAWSFTMAAILWLARVRATGPQAMSRNDGDLADEPAIAAVIATLPGPVILIAPGDTIAAFNSQARELIGGLRLAVPASAATRHPDLLRAIRQARSAASVQKIRYEERVPVERRIEATVAPIQTGDIASRYLIVALRDLTEEARVEQMRADFVANASHELRTPLASLQGFIETLQGSAKNDPAARERFLGVMASQATRMTRLIDDLMSLSKIEMREHVVPDGVADVAEIIEHIAQTFEPLAREANATIEVATIAEPILIRGDEQELEQVVQNLVQNAIKYGRKGGTIRVSVARRAANGGQIAISVADDGPGIAPEHLPRLTERFYRVDVPESRNRGGTGLGLAIVKHILNRHRGELSIRSEVGKGSTFTAILPAI